MQYAWDRHWIASSNYLLPLGLHSTPLSADFTNMHQQLQLHFKLILAREPLYFYFQLPYSVKTKRKFSVESTLTSTVIPFSVSIVVWCQGTPCSLAVFSRATVVLTSLVHEWEHAAVSGSRALSTRAYWKVKSDRVLRVITVLYVLRQPVTCSDSLRRLTTARYVLQQRITCWDSGLSLHEELQLSWRENSLTIHPVDVIGPRASFAISTSIRWSVLPVCHIGPGSSSTPSLMLHAKDFEALHQCE